VGYRAIFFTHCLAGRAFYVSNNCGIKIMLPSESFSMDADRI